MLNTQTQLVLESSRGSITHKYLRLSKQMQGMSLFIFRRLIDTDVIEEYSGVTCIGFDRSIY